MKIPINIQRLQLSMERFLITKNAKLSDLFIVCWAPEEAEFEKELDDDFIKTLISNIYAKDPKFNFLERINAKRIKVFFSKKCEKTILVNNKVTKLPTQYLMDHRKFNYPKISKVSDRPYLIIDGKVSHIN